MEIEIVWLGYQTSSLSREKIHEYCLGTRAQVTRLQYYMTINPTHVITDSQGTCH
jgi:uncharacterized metal-binding protein